MNISDFRVEPADYKVDFDDLRGIREEVFVIEQQIPRDLEFDSIDPTCHHVIARDNLHHAVGTARLSNDFKIGRMAVLADWRGKGVGTALLLALLEKARKLGGTEISLNAQTSVLGFYEKFGFNTVGDVFMEANIPHQQMRLPLQALKKPVRPAPKPRDAIVEISEFTTLTEVHSATLQLLAKARRQLCIYTPDLELPLYGHKETVTALKQFAINSGGGIVMVILQDTLPVRGQTHPLLDLAQRLPSLFMFRTPVEPEDLQYPSAFMVNDRDGYLFRQQSDHYRGVWSPAMPARNRQLLDEFVNVWQRCRPCTEFRVLGL